MSDDGNVEYNIMDELHDPMAQNDMGGEQDYNHGIFSYRIEESLAENMYNLSMEADDNDDDVDLNPAPSSRPPPEPFGIDDLSEDDPSELENVTTFAIISEMSTDARVLMKSINPEYFKYETVLEELDKWSWITDDPLEEDFSSLNGDSSYSP